MDPRNLAEPSQACSRARTQRITLCGNAYPQHNWSKTRILQFFAVLDWMMRLPEELESKLWHDIENFEGERNVKYITSVERLAIERGIQQGMTGLAQATPDQLEIWADRVLDADSLDDVFSEN